MQVLALQSPYFEAMFFGEFKERNQDLVEVKGVSAYEFDDLLLAVYPNSPEITGLCQG